MEHGVGGESTLHPVLKVRLSRQLVHIIYARESRPMGAMPISPVGIYIRRASHFIRVHVRKAACVIILYTRSYALGTHNSSVSRISRDRRPGGRGEQLAAASPAPRVVSTRVALGRARPLPAMPCHAAMRAIARRGLAPRGRRGRRRGGWRARRPSTPAAPWLQRRRCPRRSAPERSCRQRAAAARVGRAARRAVPPRRARAARRRATRRRARRRRETPQWHGRRLRSAWRVRASSGVRGPHYSASRRRQRSRLPARPQRRSGRPSSA